MKNGAMELPPLVAEVLAKHSKPRQWQLLVRGMADERLAMLRAQETIENVEVHAPNLEEIFIAYMQNGRDASSGGGVGPETQTDATPRSPAQEVQS